MDVPIRFDPAEITSEVDCNKEEILPIDPIFAWHAGMQERRPRSGWACTISLFILEDNFALNEEVESEIAFIMYNIGDDDICEIVDLEVAEVLRGHGLGQRLVEEALADLSLKGASSVWAAVSSGTPAESGTPKVAAPDPAATSSASTWPW